MIKKILIITLFVTSLFSAQDSNIGLNVSLSHMQYSQEHESGSIILGNDPDKNFLDIELYTIIESLSYESYKPQVSYIYSTNTEFTMHTILLGYNKYFDTKSANYYMGLLLGYGTLIWEYDPLNSSSAKNVDANSIVGGLQLGVEIPINSTISFNINSKYLLSNYETYLRSGTTTSKITHEAMASVGVGLLFRF